MNYQAHLKDLDPFGLEWMEQITALSIADHMRLRPAGETVAHYLATGGAETAAMKVLEAMQSHGVDLDRL